MGFFTVFKLAKRGFSDRGLVCDADGLMLGPIPLVSSLMRGASGNGRKLRAITSRQLATVLTVAYGPDFELELAYRASALKAIEQALNEDRLTEATIATLHLRLPELTPEAVKNLAALAKYSLDEPRDWHGRWTIGSSARNPSEIQDGGTLTAGGSDSLSRCIDECWRILEKPLPYKWSDLNQFEFRRCVQECRQRF